MDANEEGSEVNFGFLIDNTSCIGCHACSTACKSEHQVPLGVHRTWVKQVEVGTYPQVRRSFQVSRCNHCEDAPCVQICPTKAMHARPDGIVDFDSDACIGCKACMQACPYDAIHLDPETHTAAKCNFCAHRVEVGMEPACVVVCPEHAILAGDLNDPTSEISRVKAAHNTTVRKPEAGTTPNLFYIDGLQEALVPAPTGAMMYADVLGPSLNPGERSHVVFNAQHAIQWHWQIPAYLITKYIAGGTFMLLGIGVFTGFTTPWLVTLAGGLGVLATLVTLGLLIADLDRPDRFFFLLTRPQWGSWVARAAWLLTAFSLVTGFWWASELFGLTTPLMRRLFGATSIPLGFGAAVYTAFLLAQAKGRPLWSGTHLSFQMTLHTLVFGAGVLAVGEVPWMREIFLGSLGASFVLTLLADWSTILPWGRYQREYWLGGMALGHGLAALLGWLGGPFGAVFAVAAAGLGLYGYNLALILAPQEIPNS